jgi:ABC-type transporter lipoprotein component MlaA
MTCNNYYLAGANLKSSLSSLPALALAAFITMQPAMLNGQGTTSNGKTNKLESGQMPYFDVPPDPIEGFNRCSWAFNDCLFRGVIYPASFGYNFVVPKPLRTKISNVGHNLSYLTLMIAWREAAGKLGSLTFDRYVTVNCSQGKGDVKKSKKQNSL